MMAPGRTVVGLPLLTNTGDQTKIQVALHEISPTNPYRILCPLSRSHWLIWYGAGDITIAYHVSDLALLLSSETFTNHYHRGGGQGIDLSVGDSVAGWASVARVIEG